MTTGVHSPRLEQNIGFALVAMEWADAAGGLSVETAEGRRNLAFAAMPFIDPGKQIPRAALR